MSGRAGGLRLRFLLDEHVNLRALPRLRDRSVDIVSASEAGLEGAPDPVVFEWTRREGRILVTRNYRDFAPLVEEASRKGTAFPGVLFLARSIPQGDVGAHVRALEQWIAAATSAGTNPAESTCVWVR